MTTSQADIQSLNIDLILNELKHMRTSIDKLDKRLERTENHVALTITQSNRIDAIALNILNLEHRTEAHEQDIKTISRFQASCPRDNFEKGLDMIKVDMKSAIKAQWVAIGILTAALAASGFWNQVFK